MPSFNIHQKIKEFLSDNFDELLIICPFISLKGIESVLSNLDNPKKIKITIITRWRKLDIISGVSDIDIYPFLKKYNIKLYHHDSIHLKVFIKDKIDCLYGSANITLAGIGLSSKPNIEIVGKEEINKNKYAEFHKLIESDICMQIDDKFYNDMKLIREENKDLTKKLLKIKETHIENFEWYKWLSDTYNRDDFMKLWSGK